MIINVCTWHGQSTLHRDWYSAQVRLLAIKRLVQLDSIIGQGALFHSSGPTLVLDQKPGPSIRRQWERCSL